MITYIILASIIIICLIIIGFIIFKKFPKLSAIDLEAMKKYKQSQVKVSIVEERLERNLRIIKNKISVKSAPARKRIANKVKNWYQKALHLQRQYKQKITQDKPLKLQDKESLRQKVYNLIQKALDLIKQQKFVDAEKVLIEAISIDKQNIETYKTLGDLYIQKKDYEHAKETFEFIKQINSSDEAIWRQLGLLFELTNNLTESVKYYKKAVDLSPNNPKNLDLLLDICIKDKDSYLAKSTFEKLKQVNPENQKLADYQKKIEELK